MLILPSPPLSLSVYFRGLANDAALDSILDSKGKHQQDLISDLLADEKYQREAFTAMFVKEDQRHKEICTQVEQIQAELANLTVIEMTKKDLKASQSVESWWTKLALPKKYILCFLTFW